MVVLRAADVRAANAEILTSQGLPALVSSDLLQEGLTWPQADA